MAFPFKGGHSLAIATSNITLCCVGLVLGTIRLHVARITGRWKWDDSMSDSTNVRSALY